MFAPLAGLNKARRQFLAQAEEVLAASSLPSHPNVLMRHTGSGMNGNLQLHLQISGNGQQPVISTGSFCLYGFSGKRTRGC